MFFRTSHFLISVPALGRVLFPLLVVVVAVVAVVEVMVLLLLLLEVVCGR